MIDIDPNRSKRTTLPPAAIAIIALVAVMVCGAFISLQILKRLPSRQLSRFPGWVQNIVIPEPESAILPDVGEVDASSLLGDGAAPAEPVAEEAESAETQPPVEEEAADVVAEAEQPAESDPLPEPVVSTPTALPTLPPADAEPTPTLRPDIPTLTPTSEPTLEPTPDPAQPVVESVESAEPLPDFVRIADVTHHMQDWNNCGPATLAMALSTFGETFTQYDTAAYLKPNAEDRNVTPQQMASFVNTQTGFKALERVNGNLDLLKTLLANEFPVVLEIGLDPPGPVAWLEWYGHYILAVGYDNSTEELWVFDSLIWDDPALADVNSTEGRAYGYQDLLTYWPQFNKSYVVLYPPEREAELAAILGADYDLVSMWEGALETAQTTLVNQPDNAFQWFNLGTAYNSLGQHAEAATAFDKARSIGLPWRMLWYQFGPYEAYYNMGRFTDIILLADLTLQGRPYFEESFFWRGKAHEALGDLNSARSDFEAAQNFNPNYAPATDALAALGN